MSTIGTPLSSSATRVLLLGSGELGKEVAIELQRFGCEVIAVDRYQNAPAMQVAHRSHVISMLDGRALRAVIEQERPQLVVPESKPSPRRRCWNWKPKATTSFRPRAARLTMDREGIRRLAAEELGLRTSPFRFASTEDEFREAVAALGMPRDQAGDESSGKGQSVVRSAADLQHSWDYSQQGGRAGGGRIIIELHPLRLRDHAADGAPRRHTVFARLSATCRSTATIASPGSRNP
jgi:phosphoribosylglycinamide formyltransferase 2